jgi:hypothetical protein
MPTCITLPVIMDQLLKAGELERRTVYEQDSLMFLAKSCVAFLILLVKHYNFCLALYPFLFF